MPKRNSKSARKIPDDEVVKYLTSHGCPVEDWWVEGGRLVFRQGTEAYVLMTDDDAMARAVCQYLESRSQIK